jgi:hypothetical protein
MWRRHLRLLNKISAFVAPSDTGWVLAQLEIPEQLEVFGSGDPLTRIPTTSRTKLPYRRLSRPK